MINTIKLTPRLQRCFDYMLENGSITTLEAINKLGDTRLSATIFELKKKGVKIASEPLKVKNRYDEKRRIVKYWIS